LHADDGGNECGAGNNDILAMGEGDEALLADDDSGALRADGGSDVSSDGCGGDDATTPVIGAIGADSRLSAGDVLAAISGGAIDAIWGCGSVTIDDGDLVAIDDDRGNPDANALRVGGDDDTDIPLGNCTMVVLAGDDLAARPSGAGSSVGKGDAVSVGDISTIGGIGLAPAIAEAQAVTQSVVGRTTAPKVRTT
jgi:hypothetical protein